MISTLEQLESKADLLEAAVRQWTWKTPALKAMTLGICQLALAKSGADFSANDLPAELHTASHQGGVGIAGVAFNRLVKDGVLARAGSFEGTTFLPKIVLNAGGNKIGVYRLKNFSLARRIVEIHGGAAPAATQSEMKL